MAKKADLSNLINKKPVTKSVKKSKTPDYETDISKIHKSKPKTKTPIKSSTIDFPKDLWLNLRTKALERGISFKALIVEYCNEGLEKDE